MIPDLPNLSPDAIRQPTLPLVSRASHPPRILLLYGSLRERSYSRFATREAERLLRTSIEYAFTHPEASRTYIKQHAQELDDKVIDAHIALFVNGYSLSLGDEGRRAVEALTGVIP